MPSVGLMRKEVAGEYGGRQATRSITVLRGPGDDAICFFYPPPRQNLPLFRTQKDKPPSIFSPRCTREEGGTHNPSRERGTNKMRTF